MTILIDWLHEHPTNNIEQDLQVKIEQCILEAARITDTNNVELSIMFVDKDKIKEINREYRNIDNYTDVISFALNDNDDENIIEPNTSFLGDIIICIDVAKEQAEEYGHGITREMCFLAVHGFLHLVGYDHQNDDEEIEMFNLQDMILTNKGL